MKQVFIVFLILSSCVGNAPEEPDIINLEIIWKKNTNNLDAPDAQPIIIDDEKIIISGEKDLVAVDIDNGEEIWRGTIDNEGALISAVLLYDEQHKRIVSNHLEDFKVWDSKTGELLFTLTEETGVQAFTLGKHAILENGYAIVGDTLDAYVIEPDGKIRYTIQVPFASAGLAFSENKLYMTMGKTINGGLTKGKIIAFNVQSGGILWAYETDDGGFVRAAPIVEGGVVYAGAIGNSPVQEFVALDAETGQVIWRQTNKVWTFSFILGPEHVYVNTSGTLAALNKINGSVAWRYEWSSGTSMQPVYLEGYVYHSDHGRIFVLDAETGQLVHEEPVPLGGSYFWHLAASSDKIFAQTSRQLIAYQPWHLREE